jgi:multisubunit Na+/H+ antiporter MnhG subunit
MAVVLVVIGIFLLMLGLLGGSNVPLIIVGLLIVVAAGVLQMRIARRT